MFKKLFFIVMVLVVVSFSKDYVCELNENLFKKVKIKKECTLIIKDSTKYVYNVKNNSIINTENNDEIITIEYEQKNINYSFILIGTIITIIILFLI